MLRWDKVRLGSRHQVLRKEDCLPKSEEHLEPHVLGKDALNRKVFVGKQGWILGMLQYKQEGEKVEKKKSQEVETGSAPVMLREINRVVTIRNLRMFSRKTEMHML